MLIQRWLHFFLVTASLKFNIIHLSKGRSKQTPPWLENKIVPSRDTLVAGRGNVFVQSSARHVLPSLLRQDDLPDELRCTAIVIEPRHANPSMTMKGKWNTGTRSCQRFRFSLQVPLARPCPPWLRPLLPRSTSNSSVDGLDFVHE